MLIIWPDIRDGQLKRGGKVFESAFRILKSADTSGPTIVQRQAVEVAMMSLAEGAACGDPYCHEMTSIVGGAAAAWGDGDIWRELYSVVRHDTDMDVWDVKLFVKVLQGRLNRDLILSTFVLPASSSLARD